jgi:hypothetical protein
MEQQPAYAQPQYVMVQAPPQSSTNWLGVFGFLVALIGIFVPTGIVSLIGIAMCLGAIGRAHWGDDNAYAETLFRTLKYRPAYAATGVRSPQFACTTT